MVKLTLVNYDAGHGIVSGFFLLPCDAKGRPVITDAVTHAIRERHRMPEWECLRIIG